MFKIIKTKPNTTGSIAIDLCNDYEEAKQRLNEIARRREEHGYEVSELEDDTIEVTCDYEADIILYHIEAA